MYQYTTRTMPCTHEWLGPFFNQDANNILPQGLSANTKTKPSFIMHAVKSYNGYMHTEHSGYQLSSALQCVHIRTRVLQVFPLKTFRHFNSPPDQTSTYSKCRSLDVLACTCTNTCTLYMYLYIHCTFYNVNSLQFKALQIRLRGGLRIEA